jgi:hypothetical protein
VIAELCHPDRSGPVFSCAPKLGVPGHEAEGSLFDRAAYVNVSHQDGALDFSFFLFLLKTDN